MNDYECFSHRIDNRSLPHDQDLPGRADTILICGIYCRSLLPGESRTIFCAIYGTFSGLDLYYTDPSQHLITAVWDLDDLDRDLSDLSVRRVDYFVG